MDGLNLSLLSVLSQVVVAVLALAYPIFIQTINRVEDQYNSPQIQDILESEKAWTRLELSLKFSVGFLITYHTIQLVGSTSQQHFWTQVETFISRSNLSATQFWFTSISGIAFSISAIVLIMYTFGFFNLIKIYFRPQKLLLRLMGKKNDDVYIIATGDVVSRAIKNDIRFDILEILKYYNGLIKERTKNDSNEQELPAIVAESLLRIADTLSSYDTESYKSLNDRIYGARWLLDLKEKALDDSFFRFYWRLILKAFHKERSDLVLVFWANVHQTVCEIDLDSRRDYDQDTRNQRKELKRKLIEICDFVGALVLEKNNTLLLQKMFTYTSEQPPSYHLLPRDMDDVIRKFFHYLDLWGDRFPWLQAKYPFPDVAGMEADKVIKSALVRYIGILFLRQYVVAPRFSNTNAIGLPKLPNTYREASLWLNGVPEFEKAVNDALSRTDLIEIFKTDRVKPWWYKGQDYTEPQDFGENLQEALEAELKKRRENQTLDVDLVNTLVENTISATAEMYSEIENLTISSKGGPGPSTFYKVQDFVHKVEKLTFTKDTNVDRSTYLRSVGEWVKERISETWSLAVKAGIMHKLSIKEDDLQTCIDKIVREKNHYFVINFGYHLGWYKQKGIIKEDKIAGLPIVDFRNSIENSMHPSLLIVRADQKPFRFFDKPDAEMIKVHALNQIASKYEVFLGVSDLARNKGLVQRLNINDPEASEKAIVTVVNRCQFWAPDCANYVMLKVLNDWDNEQANEISSIDLNLER